MIKYPFISAVAFLMATPALAQFTDEDAAFAAEIERQERLDEAVLAVDGLVESMLDMPVGRLVEMLPSETAPRVPVDPDDTLREWGSRNDPAFEENVRGGARAMTAVIGDMMQDWAARLPELEGWGEGAE